MKNTFILMAIFLILMTGTCRAQPRVDLEPRSYVVPEAVEEGRVVLGTFWVRNTGSETLAVYKVVPSCGCLASYYDAAIEPGEKGRIELKFNTSGLHGRITKKALVQTNDPESPKLLIELAVEVK